MPTAHTGRPLCIFDGHSSKSEMSLVTDIVTDVLIRFPIIAQRLKGTYYFHRVVGLVVISNSVIINIPQ